MKKIDMELEFQKGARVDVVVLDDGELPADVLAQFPTAVYSSVEYEFTPQVAATLGPRDIARRSRPVGSRRPKNWWGDSDFTDDVTVTVIIIVVSMAITIIAGLSWLSSV